MTNNVSYNNPQKTKDGIIYSLDNVRLELDFGMKCQRVADEMSRLATYNPSIKVQYYHSYSPFAYVHQWTISSGDIERGQASWTLLMCFGNSKNQSGILDFNPNKCEKNADFQRFLVLIRNNTCIRQVRTYDLAIDIPLSRENFFMERDGRKKYQYFLSGDGVTEYSGTRSHSGFVKLYDKTKESKLNYPLTRLELTLARGILAESVCPVIHYHDPQQKINLAQTLSANDKVFLSAMLATENPQFFLNQLTYRARQKFEPYISDKTFQINSKLADAIYRQALSYE